MPGLVRGHVGQLVGPGDIAGSIDIRKNGLQAVIGLQGIGSRNAQRLQSVTGQPGAAPHGTNQLVKDQRLFVGLIAFQSIPGLHPQRFFATQQFAACCLLAQ